MKKQTAQVIHTLLTFVIDTEVSETGIGHGYIPAAYLHYLRLAQTSLAKKLATPTKFFEQANEPNVDVESLIKTLESKDR